MLTLPEPLMVGIVGSNSTVSQYITLNFHIPGMLNGQPAVGTFKRAAYIVDHLKAGLLMGIDIIAAEEFQFDFRQLKITMPNCEGLEVPIKVTMRQDATVARMARLTKQTIVPARSVTWLPVNIPGKPLPNHGDLLMEPEFPGVFAHLADIQSANKMLIANPSKKTMVMPKGKAITKLSTISDKQVSPAPTINPFKAIKGMLSIAKGGPLENKLPNGVTIYGDESTFTILGQVMENYPSIWSGKGVVNLPEEEWMPVRLKDN